MIWWCNTTAHNQRENIQVCRVMVANSSYYIVEDFSAKHHGEGRSSYLTRLKALTTLLMAGSRASILLLWWCPLFSNCHYLQTMVEHSLTVMIFSLIYFGLSAMMMLHCSTKRDASISSLWRNRAYEDVVDVVLHYETTGIINRFCETISNEMTPNYILLTSIYNL